MNTTRYVIISLPPPELEAKLETFRRPLCKRYKAPAVLAYPPHITLRTGAFVPEGCEAEFFAGIEKAVRGTRPFEVQTCGVWFGTHQEKPIVALDIEPVPELMGLHKKLLTFSKWQKRGQPCFRPHISLLFGDLSPAAFQRAKKERQANPQAFEFSCRFILDHVGLYRFDARQWIEAHRIQLG